MAKRPFLWFLFVGIAVAPVAAFAQQSTFCHSEVQACTDPELGCVAIPTSLRPLSTLPDQDDGWLPGGVCGTRSCYMILRCPCGNSLSKSVCIEGGGGGACDCGPQAGGEPCEYFAGKLNQMLDPGRLARARETPPQTPVKLYIPQDGPSSLSPSHRELLESWRGFFQNLTTVQLETGVWLNFPGRNGDGELKYWADGPKYRLRATADPRLGLASDLETAFDGKLYQLLYIADSRLSLQRQDPRQIPAPFPNSLYLPVSFLGISGDYCDTCEWKADDIRDSNRWRQRLDLARTETPSSFAVPGGNLHGQPFYYRVTAGKDGFIARIESVLSTGKVFRAVDLSNYQKAEGSPHSYPFHLAMTGFDEAGQILGTVHYMVTALRVNAPVKSDRFTIPRSGAKVVIDEDAPAFLKHPQLRNPPGRSENH